MRPSSLRARVVGGATAALAAAALAGGALSSCQPWAQSRPVPDRCETAPPSSRDACVLSWVTEEGTAPQSGAEVLEWCRTLRDADMLDQCLDHAVSRTPPAPDETCSAIRTPRIRESCALAVADRRRPGHQTLGPMLEDCAPTGATLPFCLTHVIEDRTAWWSHQPVDTVVAEIGAMVARFPEAGTSETVALSMFVAMSRPGFPDATRRRACTALPAPTDAYCLAPPMSRGLCPEPGSSPQRLVACDDLPGGAHRQGPPVQAPSAPGP